MKPPSAGPASGPPPLELLLDDEEEDEDDEEEAPPELLAAPELLLDPLEPPLLDEDEDDDEEFPPEPLAAPELELLELELELLELPSSPAPGVNAEQEARVRAAPTAARAWNLKGNLQGLGTPGGLANARPNGVSSQNGGLRHGSHGGRRQFSAGSCEMCVGWAHGCS